MRNFKKFLALVLAMLMVSACAVSVSAAYADQDAVRATGYETAVNVLSDLKVISGTDAGEFNPNGTLTRAAAAKMASLLKAGSNGQKIEWKSTTSYFDDVDPAHWGNAYINYAFQNGLMEGTGEGFKPDATLSVAEAIVIAVKTAGLKAQVAELEKIATASYWAASWISVADTYSLTSGINVFDYAAPCTRAQFAQIAYNVLLRIPAIRNGFGNDFYINTITAQITSVKDNKVTLDYGWKVIDLATFEAALDANGIEQSAEELKGVMLKVMISKNTLYSVEIASDVAAFTYADGKIENMYKDNNPNKDLLNTIKIDGVVYAVAESDSADDQSVIGSTAVVNGIDVYVDNMYWNDPDKVTGWLDAEKTIWGVISNGEQIAARTLPTYYKAVAYDDDADGEYDRLEIDTYEIATVKFEKTNSKGVDLYTINYNGSYYTTNQADKADNEKPITWTGVDVVADNETPMLVSTHMYMNEAGNAYIMDVLEVAEIVTGKLTGVAATYVKIDGVNYGFVANKQDIENWSLNQTVSVYTIGGKYVKYATASYSDIEVVVNSAVVTDGKAVITGYNKSANYADITVTVEGIKDESGRLVSKIGYQHTDKDKDDKDYNTVVSVGYVKSDNTFVADRTFNEGEIVTLRQIKDGAAYVISADNAAFIASTGTATSAVKFEVKNGYIYTASDVNADLVATAYAASDIVILEYTANADLAKAEKTDSYDYINYNKLSTYAARKNVNYNYVLKDGKTSFVYVAGSNALTTITKSAPLAEGQAIVYVYNFTAIEAAFDHSVYEAVNLMTGEKITVKDTSKISSANVYYVIDADNNVVEVCEFIGTKFIAKVDYTGHIGVIKAKATVETYNSADKSTDYIQEGDELAFGLDTITIYNKGILDGDKNVSKADVQKTLLPDIALEEKVDHTIAGDIYVVAGQMIIVLK